jgi:hypothetical protein
VIKEYKWAGPATLSLFFTRQCLAHIRPYIRPLVVSHSLTSFPCTPITSVSHRPPLPSHYYHDHPISEILPVRQGYLRREAHGSAKSIVRSLFTTSSQKYGQRFVAPKHVCAAGSRGRGQGTCYNAFRRGLTLMLFRSTASEGPLQNCCIVSSANTSIHAYIHEPSM